MTATIHFNRDAIPKKLGGNRRLLEELIEIFLEEGPRNLDSIRDGCECNDAAPVRIASHTIKGSLSYFGIDRTIQLADQLEILGRNGQLERVVPLLTELEDHVRLLCEEPRTFEPLPLTR